MMNSEDLKKLDSLLDLLIKAAPCKGKICIGNQNCEFGENGCYGDSCAIEDVRNALYCVKND